MSDEEFVQLNTGDVAREQEKELEKAKQDLEIISDQYINVKGMLDKTTDEGDKNLLKDNLKKLGKEITTKAMSIEEKRKQFDKNAKPVIDDINWKIKQLDIQWDKFDKKLKEKGRLDNDREVKDMRKVFQDRRKISHLNKYLFGGKRKYKRTTRMKRKSLRCPCPCRKSVKKCVCKKKCRKCNCRAIRRLRKKLKSCKKKTRRRKRTRKKRKKTKKRRRKR